jgi:hypothetical protein
VSLAHVCHGFKICVAKGFLIKTADDAVKKTRKNGATYVLGDLETIERNVQNVASTRNVSNEKRCSYKQRNVAPTSNETPKTLLLRATVPSINKEIPIFKEMDRNNWRTIAHKVMEGINSYGPDERIDLTQFLGEDIMQVVSKIGTSFFRNLPRDKFTVHNAASALKDAWETA